MVGVSLGWGLGSIGEVFLKRGVGKPKGRSGVRQLFDKKKGWPVVFSFVGKTAERRIGKNNEVGGRGWKKKKNMGGDQTFVLRITAPWRGASGKGKDLPQMTVSIHPASIAFPRGERAGQG